MFCRLGTKQSGNEGIQAFELCVVPQCLCDFARLISKLIQTTLTAHHQHAIQRGFYCFLWQHASGPTASSSQIFQVAAWVTGHKECAIWRVVRRSVTPRTRARKDVYRETREFQNAARVATGDR